jgi:hypothetical protein
LRIGFALGANTNDAGEAVNGPSVDVPIDARTIRVVVDRVIDGYSLTVSITSGERSRVLAETTVSTFDEAEKIARAQATDNGFPWDKVAVICR